MVTLPLALLQLPSGLYQARFSMRGSLYLQPNSTGFLLALFFNPESWNQNIPLPPTITQITLLIVTAVKISNPTTLCSVLHLTWRTKLHTHTKKK
jgi:hypothetical protein